MEEELVQRLMDIGGCGAETEWAQGYDDGVNAAIDEVERYFEQPTLNENQQIVLEWLKDLYGCHYYQPFVAVSLFRHSFWTEKIEENYNHLDRKQQAQVLEVFSRWAQEQEEE